MKNRATAVTISAACAVLILSGCTTGGDDGGGGDDGTLTFWVQEDLPDRVAATQEIVDAFTADSGTEVEVVSVGEDQFSQLITSAAAAGDLPDVIGGISLPQVRTLSANELIDTDAVAAVIDALDPSTFSEKALELTSDGDTALAVPSESWTQMLYYRTDLFDAAGLDAPDSYDAILEAAAALDSDEMAGFVGATAPGDAFTEQTFEHIALGNGCELVDDEGETRLDSDACVAALDFYGDLVTNYSVPGAQDVDTTRATYFAGDAAMFIWSSFVLDELAGLREDAKPSCPECVDDPSFLAANTGVVTAITGPDADSPAQFGEITSWTVTEGADTEGAQAFIEYMMSDGYEPWIAIAPEGKVPVRTGTSDETMLYAELWGTLPAGVDTKAPLSDFYAPEVLEAVAAGPEDLARWGITQGQGTLLGALQGELPVAEAVSQVAQGDDPAAVAANAAEAVRAVAESIR
ncbi:extracellular solute-binding protein [Microbacterium sp. zg.Y1090]|uniref:ABC transporter substrate-binding protein n=1 Tax=Microbacterium TaxID=33882 RepID=UPI00214CB86B|nr:MULTISPECIES: extracellular solute-binding protein [unclassified Microbacterium]MCR2812862.1 extracellular solute-binding protein [Microbacterium sp. zg.Y1084]MCR2817335.1 extracellular solute-binding protein [Microbacterium sp. zg.Y1090]WIM29177.1 extracellular solute-binding protein [Microbacterium sp. zg-Y1090]